MNDNFGQTSELFQTLNMSSKKSFIPIRSVVYRKSLENYKDLKLNQERLMGHTKVLSPISSGLMTPFEIIY
jgi:hypothetical protein